MLIFFVTLAHLLLFFNVNMKAVKEEEGITIATLCGTAFITEPVIIELMQSQAFKRLAHIHQYGISYYLRDEQFYSRYDHSLGVFMLVRRYGGTLKEQIAALLHDLSHTVFSHLADFMVNTTCKKESYQDSIHHWFLSQTEIPQILKKYGFSAADLVAHKKCYRLLESDLPDMCADRIEYLLMGGLLENYLTIQDIEQILKALYYEDGTWFFDDRTMAKKLASASLYLTEHVFGSARNWFINTLGSKIMFRALECNFITQDDIHFATDAYVWDILNKSNDSVIHYWLKILEEHQYSVEAVSEDEEYGACVFQKFRGIDPWVKSSTLKRLTEIDVDYASKYRDLKKRFSQGLKIAFIDQKVRVLLSNKNTPAGL